MVVNQYMEKMDKKDIDMHAIAEAVLELVAKEHLDFSLTITKENGKAVYMLKFSRPDETQKHTRNPVAESRASNTMSPQNIMLFEQLRRLRVLFAEEERVSCFVIAHDQVLKDIATSRPKNDDELLKIKGIGDNKLSKYGPSIHAVLNGMSPEEAFLKRPITTQLVSNTVVSNLEPDVSSTERNKGKAKQVNNETTAVLPEAWKPYYQQLYYYKNDPNRVVSPNSKFGKWCAKMGYNPRDVINGRIAI